MAGAPAHTGEYAQRRARGLTAAGWAVHVLVDDTAWPPTAGLQAAGAIVHRLADTACPPEAAVAGPNQTPALRRGDRIRHALAALHRAHAFALIEFADRGGLALRTIQARRAGLDLVDAGLLVRVEGPDCVTRHQQGRWPVSASDLLDDFAERYAVEHADHRLIGSPTAYADMARRGWRLGPATPVAAFEASDQALHEGYAALLPEAPDAHASARRLPQVTVSVAHYNLGAYLGATLASLAAQTYANLEVHVIDDGSTDAGARATLKELQGHYPAFQFHRQANAGIGATRNRGLALARGEYFLPMDADNVARPDMIARFVAAADRAPDGAAFTCDFLAFAEDADLRAERFAYAYRPTGGPHVLASMKNVYGDGNALFRTDALRAVGGFGTERDTSWEDWEVFVKLVNAGQRIEVVPAPLFFYRHRDAGFSRVTDDYANHQRVLRAFVESEGPPPAEREVLWNALAGFQRRLEFLEDENRGLRRHLATARYRWADRLHGLLGRVPRALGAARRILRPAGAGSRESVSVTSE